MVQLWIAIGTVEWCVIGFIAAMAVVAAVIKPPQRHEAMTMFLKGGMEPVCASTPAGEPELVIYVSDRGPVITRRGFDGLLRTGGSSVALAVTVSGYDVTIKERLVPGYGDEFIGTVSFDASGLRLRGNYHVQYISDSLSRSTAFSLLTRPGVRVVRTLRQ